MTPKKVSFSTPLSFEQLTFLKRCLRGQTGTNDYGYITIPNPCGGTQQVWLTTAEYSPVQDEVMMEGYLRT